MDQSTSLMSRAEHALFLDCRPMESQTVPLPLANKDAAVLVIDTRVEHSHVDDGYAARRRSCEKASDVLKVSSLREVRSVAQLESIEDPLARRRAKHIVTENQRVLNTAEALKHGGLQEVGKLLYQSHVSMRDDSEISSEELDVAVEASLEAGAIGALMTVGGCGGSSIALIKRDQIELASAAVRTAFEQAGYKAPNIFTVVADEGAGRV